MHQEEASVLPQQQSDKHLPSLPLYCTYVMCNNYLMSFDCTRMYKKTHTTKFGDESLEMGTNNRNVSLI